MTLPADDSAEVFLLVYTLSFNFAPHVLYVLFLACYLRLFSEVSFYVKLFMLNLEQLN